MTRSAYLAQFEGWIHFNMKDLIWDSDAELNAGWLRGLLFSVSVWRRIIYRSAAGQIHPSALLCNACPESILHMLAYCPFELVVWMLVLNKLNMTQASPIATAPSLCDWWGQQVQSLDKPLRRTSRIFNNSPSTPQQVFQNYWHFWDLGYCWTQFATATGTQTVGTWLASQFYLLSCAVGYFL